jgi:deaminated glutathione amidase
MKIGLAQLNSRQDRVANLAAAGLAIDNLARQGVDLVLLPEMFNFHGLDGANAATAETIPGPSTEWAQERAREYGVFLHCGSLIERRVGDQGSGGDQVSEERLYNTSVVFDRAGVELARYSKMHLWDAKTPDGVEYRESDAITAGNEVVVCDLEGVIAGLAICYDLRFPQLFHALTDRGAQVLLVPAAFSIPTGISHWEPLLRARAIENGCYVAACGQWGGYTPDRQNYGHSMVVDPWGVVVAQCREGVDTLVAELDMEHVESVRERMPVQRHRRRDLFG